MGKIMNSNQTEMRQGNILVVDDTPDNLRLLSAILTEEGYKVRKALNGSTALGTVQAAPPDLVLLDINMPGMNGYEVCEQLKAEESTRDIPIIFISALDDVLDKVKAFAVGGVDYITKPFQGEEVLVRVANQLTICHQKQQLQAQNLQLQQEIQVRQEAEAALRIAQQKSDDLLLNILPQSIAEQLKEDQQVTPELYDEATFLFADIVGFTCTVSETSPEEVVQLLNQVFSAFDKLVERYGLEKIRTIGDAYFAAGGLPVVGPDHAETIAAMALEMQQAITHCHWNNGTPLKLRIGINTGGPVVAAVIGLKKFVYDVWGDAVNIASRMESLGQPGRIQVTASTYEQLKQKFSFEKRGKIAVKGKGEMVTYWLTGPKK